MSKELNIPIYRAKKIDSDEYVEGDFFKGKPSTGKFFIDYWFEDEHKRGKHSFEVDISTLAIHFPDSSSTQSEKVWYNMEEISNIIKEYKNGMGNN